MRGIVRSLWLSALSTNGHDFDGDVGHSDTSFTTACEDSRCRMLDGGQSMMWIKKHN